MDDNPQELRNESIVYFKLIRSSLEVVFFDPCTSNECGETEDVQRNVLR